MGTVISCVYSYYYMEEVMKRQKQREKFNSLEQVSKDINVIKNDVNNNVKKTKNVCCNRRKRGSGVTFNDVTYVKLFSSDKKIDYKLVEDYEIYID